MSETQASATLTDPSALRAVRALSGRLAHDFNNLVTPLLAYPQLVRKDLPKGAASHALLDVMETTAEDIARICQQLARLGPDAEAAPEQLQLKPIVEGVIRELEGDARTQGVSLALAVEADLPSIWMGEPQCKRMLKALIANALNALEAAAAEGRTGGGVSVSVGRHTVDAPRAVVGGHMPPGTYVRIDVIDDGVGIDEAAQGEIFEPLFTMNRKRRVRGGGLGLSLTYAMLCDAHGFIAFDSELGRGTTFSVYLPEHKPAAVVAGELPCASGDSVSAPMSVPRPASEPVPEMSARILVCDDEHVIVKLFRMMIRSGLQGVEVDEARNGEEALALFRERRHQVVVMDLHMPVMDGQTAFHAIESFCASEGCEMPTVVFCTGYAPPEGIRRLADAGSKHALLLKPVNTQVLVDAVRAGLQGGYGRRS